MPHHSWSLKLAISLLALGAGLLASYAPVFNLLHLTSGKLVVPSRYGAPSYISRDSNPAEYWGYFWGMLIVLVPFAVAFFSFGAWILLNP